MSYNFFAYISRMRYIGRWSLMRNALPENIQEHSHMVAVIAHALGIIRRDVYGIACNPEECAAVALYHDCSEILTGDLPTPNTIVLKSRTPTSRLKSLPATGFWKRSRKKSALPLLPLSAEKRKTVPTILLRLPTS